MPEQVKCPQCGQRVSVIKGGKLRAHKTPPWKMEVPCPGSGQVVKVPA